MNVQLQERVSAIVVNYQTPDLLDVAVRSFKSFYPQIPLTVIDNGSRDESRATIQRLADSLPAIEPVCLDANLYHGPAMDLGLRGVESPLAYVFDSDTETLRGGFLEAMAGVLDADDALYGAGHVVHADRRGFARPTGVPVLASAYMMLKTHIYRSLPPFVHHGLPALANFAAAEHAGYGLASWPIEEYVKHLGRGTAERYGYGLGLRAKIDYVLAKLGF
ncbi:MAG TPA: glycosyltransferase [Rhodothermales bacterium]